MIDQHAGAVAPHLDQYFGTWALLPDRFDALAQFAEQLNLQLHVEQHVAAAAEEAVYDPAKSYARIPVAAGPEGRSEVAVIELRGTMMKHVSSFSGGTSTALARRRIRDAARDSSVGGILLLVDSPGGTVAGMEDLAADLRAAGERKPVHGYAEDLAASAGYWALSQTARASAGPTAIVGSIGVFNVVHDLSGMADQKGIKVHVVRFGAQKGAGVPGTEISEETLAEYQRLVDTFGAQFVDAVAAGRKISRDAAAKLADGRVHVGAQAQALGLVDAIESLDEALAAVADAINTKSRARSRGGSQGKGATVSQQATTTTTDAADGAAPAVKSFDQERAERRAAIAAACEGASEDWIDAQVGKGATVAIASSAWMKQLAAERDAAKAEAEEARQASSRGSRQPVQQLGGESDAVGDPTEATAQFREKVDALVAGGMNRRKAVAKVATSDPELAAATHQVVERRGR